MLARMSTPRGVPEAIVRPKAGERVFDVERIAPAAPLGEFVDYYWLVRWKAGTRHHQQVVPQPRVHVAAEDGRLFVHGVSRQPFWRTLTGTGHVLGVAFYAGGFRSLLKSSVGTISGTVQPARNILGHDDRPVAMRILTATDTAEMVNAVQEYLLRCDPTSDLIGREVTTLVEEARRQRTITRAEQLASHAGASLRRLQRLFTDYVGIGPKWIIQRFRILDAVAAAHSGEPIRWGWLAGELGFSDQAHLTRVFTQVVGTPPAAYQRDPATS